MASLIDGVGANAMPIIHQSIKRLAPEWQARVAGFDAQTDERKIPMRRPRWLFILAAAPFALAGALLLALGIYGRATASFASSLADMFLATGFFAAAFMGFPGWRGLYRRRHRDRYYVYLDSRYFVERVNRTVTIIPREQLLHVHESISVDEFFTCLDYRDGAGQMHFYVLKSWYETKNSWATDLILPIRKAYGLRDLHGDDNNAATMMRDAE